MYFSLTLAMNSVLNCCIIDALEAMVKTNRVVSLQIRFVAIRDGLSY